MKLFTYLDIRNGHCHYLRRVPKKFAHIDTRVYVKKSLGTKNPQEGLKKALIYNDFVEAEWQRLDNDNPSQPMTSYDLAVKRAEFHGFNYKTVSEISDTDIDRIVARLTAATKPQESPEKIEAILGGQPHPSRTLDQLWPEYYDFNSNKLLGKSESQIKRWINPRIRAYKTFIKVCGDIPVEKINRDHIKKFRQWWLNRLSQGMSPNSANKDLMHLRTMLAFAEDNWKGIPYQVTTLFARIRFEEEDSKRQPFKTEYIQATLLNHKLLRGLNDECKYFLFAMADTGARPSELLGLDANNGDIRLDTEIPYIHIRPNNHRLLKNKPSERMIPLVGSSLYAFKYLSNGFDRYFLKPDQLSQNLNKFLRDHNLLPSDNHSVYSLRHSFEDRLCEVNPPEKVQSFILGHGYRRERYGKGPSLNQKKEWLDKICYKGFD